MSSFSRLNRFKRATYQRLIGNSSAPSTPSNSQSPTPPVSLIMAPKRLLSPPPSSPPKDTLRISTAPSTPTPSDPLPLPLPPFLALTKFQIAAQFRAIANHEITLSTTPGAYLTPHPDIQSRDRYTDIRPWAHNRISLEGFEHPEDYINASPVTLGRNERFIATQGPRSEDEGTEQFWRMAWQEGVEVVVMLTRCVEQGREKCGVYFPVDLGEEETLEIEDWGSVECVSLARVGGSEIRELKVMKHEGEEVVERTVWHFLFLGWPDMDVPKTREDQRALLDLIELTREKMGKPEEGKDASPMIVHCSAGVGRTGTFIALDHLMRELEEGKWDDLALGKAEDKDLDPIFEVVKKLRDQRMGLVYRIPQYTFIYQILKEKWEEKHDPKTPGESVVREKVLESPAKRRRFSVDEDEDDEDWPAAYAGWQGTKR